MDGIQKASRYLLPELVIDPKLHKKSKTTYPSNQPLYTLNKEKTQQKNTEKLSNKYTLKKHKKSPLLESLTLRIRLNCPSNIFNKSH